MQKLQRGLSATEYRKIEKYSKYVMNENGKIQ